MNNAAIPKQPTEKVEFLTDHFVKDHLGNVTETFKAREIYDLHPEDVRKYIASDKARRINSELVVSEGDEGSDEGSDERRENSAQELNNGVDPSPRGNGSREPGRRGAKTHQRGKSDK